MKTRIPLKYRLVMILLSVAILVIFTLSFFNYRNIVGILEDEHKTRRDLIEQGIFSAVVSADAATRIIESQLNASMERYTHLMLEKYSENPDVLSWDLLAMKKEFNGYDIYIIDENLVVVHTSYQEDLGLDFTQYPQFAQILQGRLKGDQFTTDRLDISINTKETKKFSYMPTPDNRYLLELGVSMRDYFPYLEGMELDRIIRSQVDEHPAVDDITIYRINQEGRPSLSVSQIDPKSQRGQIILENEHIAQRAILENTPQQVIRREGEEESIYRYLPYLSFLPQGDMDFWNSYLVEVVFNDETLLSALGEQRYRFFSNIFTTMLVLGGLLFGTFYLFRKTEEGREKLETVIDRTSEGYYMLDGRQRITEVNAAFCQLIGYPRKEILWKRPNDFMDAKNRQLFYQESVKSSQRTHHSFEVVFLDCNHREVHVLVNSTSIKGHHERSGYYFAFVSDITQQKAEKEELKRTRDAAEAASQFKSEFLATMSHEIRTPMNGIVAMTEVLLDTDLDSDQKKYASIIWESSGILMNIINDILDFSKIEAGKMSLKPVDFSLLELLDAVTDLFSPKAAEKGLSFTSSCSPNICDYLFGDHLRIRQVLGNLISNAINFTSHGSVNIQVTVSGQKEETISVTFTVTDTGIGIGEEEKDSLFQPFTQVDSSTTRKSGGTGLGLAICRRLVDLMDGTIGFTSAPGEGSSFFFTIPLRVSSLDEVAASLGEKDVEIMGEGFHRHSILVAEDNKVNQEIACIQLRKLGFSNISVVNNGQEAVEAALETDYSLIFMDCQMPIMDGYTASKKIRREEKKRSRYTPIVAMTAHSMEGDRQKCLRMGMDDYMSKPVKLEVLRRVLQCFLKEIPMDLGEEGEEMTASIVAVIDLKVLEEVTGVPRDELHMLEDIFHIFLEDSQKKMEELEERILQEDFPAIQSAAHFLKSSSGNLGAEKFSSLSQKIEELAKKSHCSELEEIFSALKAEYSLVKEAILLLQQDACSGRRLKNSGRDPVL